MERYRFLEALDKIVGTVQRIKFNDGSDYGTYGVGWLSFDKGLLKDETGKILSWPSAEQQKSKIWEVEEKPIYVWGACGGYGTSLLFAEEPKKIIGNGWLYENDNPGVNLSKDNIFSKDKPQKYKLVLVEDE